MNARLDGKVAVVTGAAGAIGREVARRLDALGATLVLVDLRDEPLRAFAATLQRPALSVAADLSAADAPAHIAAAVHAAHGRCDLLVNNAGIVVPEPFESTPAERFEREVRVNLFGPMFLTHALYPLLQQTRGQVISVVSLGGQLPLKECPGYCASKFGLRGLMLSLALREKTTGVAISIVNPSGVDTPMIEHEALHGGSPLNFLSPPLAPGLIGDAVIRQIEQRRIETDVPSGDGWLIRFVMAFPGLYARVLPWLEASGEKGRRRYLRAKGLSLPDGGGPRSR